MKALDWYYRQKNIEALAAQGDCIGLIRIIRWVESYDHKKAAAKAIEQLGEVAVEELVKRFVSLKSDDSVGLYMVSALSEIDFRLTAPVICAQLDSKRRSRRGMACWAIGYILDHLSEDSSLSNEIGALIEKLGQTIHDSSADVRCRAVYALGKSMDSKAVPLLLEALNDKNADVRSQAADTLGSLGLIAGRQTLEPLGQAMKDRKKHVREAASKAYAKISKKVARIDAAKTSAKSIRANHELTSAILKIGASDGFLSVSPGGPFNEDLRHIEVRKIGEKLNQNGSLEAMREVASIVSEHLGPVKARELEAAWKDIGQWR